MAVPMEEVQQFERGRRRLLLWYLPGVVALCGSQIAFYSLPEMSAGTRRMMAMAVLVLFGGAMVKLSLWILRLYRRNEADRKQLMGALNDERIEHNRLLAWRDSFWAIFDRYDSARHSRRHLSSLDSPHCNEFLDPDGRLPFVRRKFSLA